VDLDAMKLSPRRLLLPVVVLGSTLVLGISECIALWRSHHREARELRRA